MCTPQNSIQHQARAHMVMEADKSQYLQGEPASWRCRRAQEVNSRSAGSRPRKSQCFVEVCHQEETQWPGQKAVRTGEFPLSWERVSSFMLFRPDRMRPTHIRDSVSMPRCPVYEDTPEYVENQMLNSFLKIGRTNIRDIFHYQYSDFFSYLYQFADKKITCWN